MNILISLTPVLVLIMLTVLLVVILHISSNYYDNGNDDISSYTYRRYRETKLRNHYTTIGVRILDEIVCTIMSKSYISEHELLKHIKHLSTKKYNVTSLDGQQYIMQTILKSFYYYEETYILKQSKYKRLKSKYLSSL